MRAHVTALLLMVFCFAVLCSEEAPAVEPDHPAELEIGLESRLSTFETSEFRIEHAHELSAQIGLAWTPIWLVTVHAQFEGSWFALLENEASYRYHNSREVMRHAGGLGVSLIVDLHPESRIVSFRTELLARSYFVSGRAGIFVIDVGLGIGVQPFIHRSDLLKSVRFGVICRIDLYDEFYDIFDLERQKPELGLQIGWIF